MNEVIKCSQCHVACVSRKCIWPYGIQSFRHRYFYMTNWPSGNVGEGLCVCLCGWYGSCGHGDERVTSSPPLLRHVYSGSLSHHYYSKVNFVAIWAGFMKLNSLKPSVRGGISFARVQILSKAKNNCSANFKTRRQHLQLRLMLSTLPIVQ